MNKELLIKIKSDPNLYNYLKYHSYWYKDLKRRPERFNEFVYEMKKEYKLTVTDKISNVNDKITFVRTFLDMLN